MSYDLAFRAMMKQSLPSVTAGTYLGCYELLQTVHSHSSPQHSSDSREARIVPGKQDGAKVKNN